MNFLSVVLPEGFPAVIEEYDWFLKNFNTPEWYLAIRIAVCVAVTFIGVTYFYYSRKDRREHKKES